MTGITPDRPPDANGWYNHNVTVTFAGSDATSGIASCDTPTYDKPDTASATVTGHCQDNAGNVSAPSSFGFKFDSTPPKLSDLTVTALDQRASLTWKRSADVATIVIIRSADGAKPTTVYDGKPTATFTDKNLRNGIRYAYTVTGIDAAGNKTTEKAAAEPSSPLFAPRKQAHVHAGVVLRWRPTAGATYYNVQLWYKGAKILTTWPTGPSFRVPSSWAYLGRTYQLRPGSYSWFVWPGKGARTRHAFGPLIGTSSFIVTR